MFSWNFLELNEKKKNGNIFELKRSTDLDNGLDKNHTNITTQNQSSNNEVSNYP